MSKILVAGEQEGGGRGEKDRKVGVLKYFKTTRTLNVFWFTFSLFWDFMAEGKMIIQPLAEKTEAYWGNIGNPF